MTPTLDAALAKLATLSPEDQERVGNWLLAELQDEEQWGDQFRASQDALQRLANETRANRKAGRTNPLDPEQM